MAKVTNLKRIVAEDFDDEYQDLIKQLSFSLNPLLEQITAAFNKNIDFDNLNQEISVFETRVDSDGIPLVKVEVKSSLKTRIKGMKIIQVNNLDDSDLLAEAPFVSFELVNNGFRVTQVVGLLPNKNYRVTVNVIG